MHKAFAIIYDEHRSISAVLSGLKSLARMAVAGNSDPIADLREKDFHALYQRILSLAPAPVGVGERWKPAL